MGLCDGRGMNGSAFHTGTGWTRATVLVRATIACLLLVVPIMFAGAQPNGGADAATGAARGDWLPLATFCHASTALPLPARDHDLPGGFFCGGSPDGYQHGSLWLQGGASAVANAGRTPVLMVHSSRFDRLLVGFRYADGITRWQEVRSGNFAGHWRLGGQVGFTAPLRDARLTGVVLRFDSLASAPLLRIRLVRADVADLQSIALASLIGATLMLLVVGAVYNFTLGLATRRTFPVLQGLWSATMAIWGAIWSQLHLLVLPGMAGTLSSQVCTLLACAMLMLTALSMISAIEPADMPRWLRRLGLGLAIVVGVLGVPLGLMRSGPIELLVNLEGVLAMAMAMVVLVCLGVAWRRGSGAARAFAGAWLMPLLVMSLSGFFDLDHLLWGGGTQMLVLLSAAWQTVWLSLAATHRFTQLRLERDRALAAQAIAQHQARCDPLTGLSNRRGFIERITPLLATGCADQGAEYTVALLLLDIDRFKAINDAHGHDTGDDVLIAIARRLQRWDSPNQVIGRMGGEEFAILVAGMGRFAAFSFAEAVRQALAENDHGLGTEPITVSIGMVMGGPGDTFATLYRAADIALYAAKNQGRNRVVMAHGTVHEPAVPAARALPEHR
jgi:diguanylate cyclase (GGDEF)-like protein